MADRYVQVRQLNGTFEVGNFDDLKKGDVFKLFEPNGTIVDDGYGNTCFVAGTDAVDGAVKVIEKWVDGKAETLSY